MLIPLTILIGVLSLFLAIGLARAAPPRWVRDADRLALTPSQTEHVSARLESPPAPAPAVVARYKRGDLVSRVLAVFASGSGPLTAAQVADQIEDRARGSVIGTCRDLVERGRLVRMPGDDGFLYRLARLPGAAPAQGRPGLEASDVCGPILAYLAAHGAHTAREIADDLPELHAPSVLASCSWLHTKGRVTRTLTKAGPRSVYVYRLATS
jgi:hypothetical protein